MVCFCISPAPVVWGMEFAQIQAGDLTIVFDRDLSGGAKEALEIYPEVKEDLEKTLKQKITFSPTLVLIKDTRVFRKMADSPFAVAFAVPERDIMVIDYSRMNVDPFSIRLTMKHELCHLLLHQIAKEGMIPKWLDEGIAQWVSAGIPEIMMNSKRSLLNEAIVSGRSLDMRALAEAFPRDEESLSLAYEASMSMVAYMIERFGVEGMMRILDRIKEGEPWETAISKALSVPFDELQRNWRHHLEKKLTWYTYLINNLYEILFSLAALLAAIGFVRAYLKKRAYMRQREEEEP
jgi:Peptidase MA superfamily